MWKMSRLHRTLYIMTLVYLVGLGLLTYADWNDSARAMSDLAVDFGLRIRWSLEPRPGAFCAYGLDGVFAGIMFGVMPRLPRMQRVVLAYTIVAMFACT